MPPCPYGGAFLESPAPEHDETKMRTTGKALVAIVIIVAVLAPDAGKELCDTTRRAIWHYVSSGNGSLDVIPAEETPTLARQPLHVERNPARTKPGSGPATNRSFGSFRTLIRGARWNPCEPIRLVYNPRHAPAGAITDLRLAVGKVASTSGLTLRVLGPTHAGADPLWSQNPSRSSWRPVLVNWGRPGHGILTDDWASATAEPVAFRNRLGEAVFVSGQVTINVEHDHLYHAGFGAYGSRVALYMHELAHIVGLDHVNDPDALMYHSVAGSRDFGPGDSAGLAKLHADHCLELPPP